MPARSVSTGSAGTTAYSSEATGYIYKSVFRANLFHTSPTTGAIGVSSIPILVTGVSPNVTSGSAVFQGNSGFSGSEAILATEDVFYGFSKGAGTINFKRGAGTNPEGIYNSAGTSLNPTTDGPAWPTTSINATISYSEIPYAPTSFVTTARTNSSVTLDWIPNSDTGGQAINGYRVLYKVRNTATDTTASSWSVKVINTASPSTLDKTISGLLANTTYDFRVAARNAVTDAHSGGVYTSASAITGVNASLNSITTDNVVIDNALTIMPEGIITVPYVGRIVSSGAVTYGVTSGSLPTGLTLNTSSGFVTGTPTVVGTYNFTITVYSGGIAATSRAFTVVIYNSSPKVITGEGTTARSTLKVYNSGWKNGFMRVYDSTYTGSDGTHWRPIS